VNSTPYWIYLTAGKKEQLALINYIRNSSVSQEKKTEWVRFLQSVWKKYPMKLIKTGSSYTLTPLNQKKMFSLTKDEAATFAEIDELVSSGIIQTASQSSQGIHPKYNYDTHLEYMKIALKTESYIPDPLKGLAEDNAFIPDTWYSSDLQGKLNHSYNHGYFPLTASSGIGLAPQNTGNYAQQAKTEFQSHNYIHAFTDLGYSSHFMGDLTQPFHTPSPLLLATGVWTYYDGPVSSSLPYQVQLYIMFHGQFENSVSKVWTTSLTNYGRSLSDYANDVTTATVITDPQASATTLADRSSDEIVPLYYLYFWHYITGDINNPNYDCVRDDPVVGAIAIDRVKASVTNIRGLARFVTEGQAPTLTISASAGSHGTISPSGSVSVNYGATPTYTFTPDTGYVVDTVTVDGVSQGSISSYLFPPVTSDQTISVTFKQNLPAIVPLCQAGTPFDNTVYPMGTPQSDPMTFTCNWDGNGRVYISGSNASLTGVYADDGFTIDIQPNGATFDAAEHWAHQHPVLELTSGMTPGSNTMTLITRNWMGLSMSYGVINGVPMQTPWIIEVNEPVSSKAAASQATLPAFITMTDNGLVVNGTLVKA
jgi:hypothetical protein